MNTDELMQIALDLVDFDEVPADSAIYVAGDGIERALFGLDIGVGELVLAHQLGYDCVIAHHPVGVSYRSWRVFERHLDFLMRSGVPKDAAREAVAKKLRALRVGGQTRNYEQVPMAAQRLGMPFLNIHCPMDEMGRRVMQSTVDDVLASDPEATLGDIVGALSALPAAKRAKTEVTALMGEPAARAGKTVAAHGALTNGGYHIARAYFEHGVDTVIYIHISPEDLKRLQEHDAGQLVVTSHLIGDALGIEPAIEAMRRRGLEVDVLSEVLTG